MTKQTTGKLATPFLICIMDDIIPFTSHEDH